ncbi:alpha/beta fold hydrolase [Alkalilimnicola sp. S0819]|uniref:alpha/beta fold hydrolase n=1 Tax=Alkalilimnicola sp. S0819 TaxID=2613922 RepID=UPI001D002ACE|nr:alpha/beta hydrolase [Alkalilimnicola sp. S0819]
MNNKPLLHFAHANGFPSGAYKALLRRLEPDHRVIAIDQVGHDKRYPVSDNWGRLADQLADFLRARADEPVVGVGHSLGALLTFLAAVRHPALFRAVVMLDPPVLFGASALVMRAAKRLGKVDALTPAGLSRGRRRHWPDREQVKAQLGRKRLFRAFDPECLDDYVRFGTAAAENGVELVFRPEVEVEIFRTIPHDLHRYSRLQVPGALVYGEGSDVALRGEVRRFARRFGLQLSAMPGGHMFPLERPAATATHLRQLIVRLLGEA